MENFIENLEKRTVVKKGSRSLVANLSDEIINGPMRGWICGHFYPKGSSFHRNDIEICVKTLPIGTCEEEHYHLCSFEFLMVISGEVIYDIQGEEMVLTPGMFYILEPGETEYIVKVVKETTIIAVRLPSIPKNKRFTKDEQQ